MGEGGKEDVAEREGGREGALEQGMIMHEMREY